MASANKYYLAHSTDENIRFNASSGGFIKSFLCHLLDSHQADYAIVTRTGGPDNPLTPETIVTNRKEDIISTRTNSVYCVNDPFKDIKIWPGKRYAFVCLPCQVRHARLYPNMACVISLICNHAPRAEFTRVILRKLGVEESQVSQIEYRGNGWPGRFTAYLKDGGTKYIAGYWNERYKPDSCRNCKQSGRDADIIAGDPWRISKDERGGTLIVCRNPRAVNMVEKAGDYVSLQPVTYADFLKSQGKHFKDKPL